MRGRRGRRVRALACLVVLALLGTACNWEPLARPAQPERLIDQPARVERLLDYQGQHVLVRVGIDAQARWRILSSDTRTTCELPAGSEPATQPLIAPRLRKDGDPAFLLPVLQPESEDAGALFFSDEACRLHGPYGTVQALPGILTLRRDERQVAIAAAPDGTLSYIDPWVPETRVLARNVRFWMPVEGEGGPNDPQLLWLLEGSMLTQRALDGTLLLSRGSDVREVVQRLYSDGARIAYRDGAALYEARGPDFVPVLIADDACRPSYTSEGLDFWTPCAAQQLVRIELANGRVRRFAPGVYRSVISAGVTIELARQSGGPIEYWVVTSAGLRRQIVPAPAGLNSVTILANGRVVGKASTGQLGVWSLDGSFAPLLSGVAELIPYQDSRTSQPLWLLRHDVVDGLGVLSTLTQRDVENALTSASPAVLNTLAAGVPAYGGAGFQVTFAGITREPVVLTIEQATARDEGFMGTLYARLLSGELASRIDDGVSSATLVVAPLPGILYGVMEGARSGLWFAAL